MIRFSIRKASQYRLGCCQLLTSLVLALCAFMSAIDAVDLPSGINHDDWTALLQIYVDDNGYIAYDRWREHAEDSKRLDAYLGQYALAKVPKATGLEYQVGLLNAYNAFTVQEVLRLDPPGSFWDHKPFDVKKYTMYGALVSLNDIEHQGARPAIGYLAHAGLVCAAVSCPPLLKEAYVPERMQQQLTERMETWLALAALNQFDPDGKTIRVSKIFEWFGEDFNGPEGLPKILANYAPSEYRDWLAVGPVTVAYIDYDQSLNAQP